MASIASPSTIQRAPTVDLKVLSQLPEPHGTLLFSSIPITTTVQELKTRIQNVIPTKPAPGTQRLIYAGRVRPNLAETLQDIFGQASIKHGETYTLHLVIRDAQVPQTNAISHSQPQQPPNNLPTPAVPALNNMTAPPNTFRQTQTHGPNGQVTVTMGWSTSHLNTHPGGPNIPNMNPFTNPMLPQNMHTSSMPVYLQQPQPANDSPYIESLDLERIQTNLSLYRDLARSMNNLMAIYEEGAHSSSPTDGYLALANRLRHLQEQRDRFNTRVTSLQREAQSSGGTPDQLTSVLVLLEDVKRDFDDLERRISRFVENPTQPNNANRDPALVQHHDNLIALQRELTSLVDEILEKLNRSSSIQEMTQAVQQLQRMESRIRMMTQDPEASPVGNNTRMPSVPNQSNDQNNVPQPASRRGNNNVTAYLLCHPTGPYAIVHTQHGTFHGTSPMTARPTGSSGNVMHQAVQQQQQQSNQQVPANLGHNIAVLNHDIAIATSSIANMHRAVSQATTAVQNLNNTYQSMQRPPSTTQPTNPPQDQLVIPEEPIPLAAAAPPAIPNAEDDAQNLARALLPILRHLWLLVRIFGFIWFFASGTSSYRLLLLGLASAAYLAIQAGLLPHWDRLRRHVEDLVGVPPEEPAQPQAPPPGPAVIAEAAPIEGRRRNPTPHEAAARILAQQAEARHAQAQAHRGWLARHLTSLERAGALFVASLYPGVGERHVAMAERQRAAQVVAVAREAAMAQEEQADGTEEVQGQEMQGQEEAQAQPPTPGGRQAESPTQQRPMSPSEIAAETARRAASTREESEDKPTAAEPVAHATDFVSADADSAGEGSSSGVSASGAQDGANVRRQAGAPRI